MIKIDRRTVATLFLSATALVALANLEAFRPSAYRDTANYVTIGYGTTQGVKMGDKITPEKALFRLLNDTYTFQTAIKQCVKVPLTQYEYDAAAIFSYNVGASAFCRSTMVKKWNAGDYQGGCEELSRWVYAGGMKSPGLVNRRAKEYRLCIGEAQ